MQRSKRITIKAVGTPGLVLHARPDWVRQIHLDDYRIQLGNLKIANEKMRHYLEVDQPAFTLWWQQRFATDLLRQIELEREMSDLDLLVDAIEQYKLFYRVSYREASRVVTQAHSEGREVLNDLMRKLFEEMDAQAKAARSPRQAALDKHNEAMIDQFFTEFETLFDEPQEGQRKRHAHPRDAETQSRREGASSADDTSEDYIKKIYRDLVRQLHPDANGGREHSVEEKILWHELQNAYQWRDIERLEAIHKILNGSERTVIDFLTIPISDIIAMKIALKKILKDVNKSLRQAKKEPNWEFQARSKKKSFLSYLARSFQEELEDQTDLMRQRVLSLRRKLKLWTVR